MSTNERSRVKSVRPGILAMAPNSWFGPWVNRQQLLTRLARRSWPILYSTGAQNVVEREKPKWKQAGWLGNTVAADGILVDCPGRLPPRWERLPAWDRFALNVHARRLHHKLQSVARGPTVLFAFHPMFWPYVKALEPRYVAFHCYDAFHLAPNWPPEYTRMLEALVRRSDVFTVSSLEMLRGLPDEIRRKARELPNGVAGDVFLAEDGRPCPADLASIPRPRVGWVGRVTAKIDLALIAEIAARRPDWHWVLVGEVHFSSTGARLPIEVPPNVHVLGERGRNEVAAYMEHMDVNTMCYRTEGSWWVASYPLKLHEYLAVGRPVVGADMPTVRPFSHVVDIARSTDDWIAAIERAVRDGGMGTVDHRRAVAAENTWDQRADVLDAWLRDIVGTG